MEKIHDTNISNPDDLVKRMAQTSTTKKKFEKILKIKRTINITFEMVLLMLNVFLVFLSLSSTGNTDITLISGLTGIATTMFIIYNKYLINIDELIFKNRTSYLMIDSLFKNIDYQEVDKSYAEYESAVALVDNTPDFVYHLTTGEKKKITFLKLLAFVMYEYIFEILILCFIFQYSY